MFETNYHKEVGHGVYYKLFSVSVLPETIMKDHQESV